MKPSRPYTAPLFLITAFLSCVLVNSAHARQLTASVTHVAWKTLYVSGGRSQGLIADLEGQLIRDGQVLGFLTIAAVAESSAVATLRGDSVIARVGDVSLFTVPDSGDIVAREQEEISIVINKEKLPARARESVRMSTRLTGRVGFQIDTQDDRSATNSDYVQTGISTKFAVKNLIGDASEFRVKYRGRKSHNRSFGGSESDQPWKHRLYEASFSLGHSDSRWRADIGRIQAGSVAGIGYLDGAYGEIDASSHVAVGGFAGAEATIDLSHEPSAMNKAGILVVVRNTSVNQRRSRATLAVAGEYHDGDISREFIYQQLTHNIGSQFSFYQSADININRGWKHDAEGAFFSIANVLANLRLAPARAITLSAGYDGRSRYHTWETRETPDSLFDEAIRHGFRFGAELTMLRGTRLSAEQGYRSEPHIKELYPSASYSLTSNVLFHGRVGAMLRYNSFENRYSTGDQRAASLSLSPSHGFDFRTEYGVTSYNFVDQDRAIENEWMRASADYNSRSGWFGSISTELGFGSSGDTRRTFVEIGRRLR